MRIDQYFVSAVTETGAGLPSDVVDGVRNVLCGPHKTFRYMLFTGLLAALRDVFARFNVIAADNVELSPQIDHTGRSTALACKLLREELCAL